MHGGEDFSEPTVLDKPTITRLKLSFLAPLHNPANVERG